MLFIETGYPNFGWKRVNTLMGNQSIVNPFKSDILVIPFILIN